MIILSEPPFVKRRNFGRRKLLSKMRIKICEKLRLVILGIL